MANRLIHDVVALERFEVTTFAELRDVLVRMQALGLDDAHLDGPHSVTLLEETLSDGSQVCELLIRPVVRY